MKCHLKYAIPFLALGIYSLVLAIKFQGLFLLMIWPGLAFTIVGLIYGVTNPDILGKQPSGQIKRWPLIFLFPYFALTWTVWKLQITFLSEPCCNEIMPGIWLGRRVYADELPSGITMVVDLTAEFNEPNAILAKSHYICLPTLDGTPPEVAPSAELLQTMDSHTGQIYVHCAAGHGRSASLVAALILKRGIAQTAAEAEATIKAKRPWVKLSRKQLQFVTDVTNVISSNNPIAKGPSQNTV